MEKIEILIVCSMISSIWVAGYLLSRVMGMG